MGDWTDRVDLLVNNAATLPASPPGLEGLEADDLLRVLRVNVLGPLVVTRAMRGLLRTARPSLVACLCSRIGVLRREAPAGPQAYGYGLSKAALHRMIPPLAAELRGDGVAVVGIDPGWVTTDTTRRAELGDRYRIDSARSVAGMLRVLGSLTLDETGTLWRWTGQRCRWYPPDETPEERQVRGTDADGQAAGEVLR